MKHTDAELFVFGSSPMVGNRITGYIYKDSKNRFEDGTVVNTSKLQKLEITEEGTFATTMNTVYKLV